MSDHNETATAEARYKRMQTDRAVFLDEAWKSAQLTLPSLIPDSQDICERRQPVELPKPWQSLGGRGVNNLASKLVVGLFPPTSPFMRYQIHPLAKNDAKREEIDLAPIQSDLATREAVIQAEVDVQGIRTKAYLTIKHLLVAGNVLLRKVKDKGLQVFPLNSYVAKRDTEGLLIETIVVEKHDRRTITDQRVIDIINLAESSIDASKEDGVVNIFTSIRRDGKKFDVVQEVGGIEVPGTKRSFKPRNLPWLTLRFTSIDGEDYGRGFVEEYRGDLTSYESLSKDMIFASANAAKVLWAIDPASGVNPKRWMELDNGQAYSGRDGDVTATKVDKGADMAAADNQINRLEKALGADFLLNSSFQRNQERVTAEEIRRLAEELEDTLGGVFSLMGQELQLPLAILLENELIANKSLLKLDEKTVRIGIVTGLAAIGRGQDLSRLKDALASVAEVATVVPGLVDYIKEGALNERIWTGTGVDTDGLLRTDEEVTKLRADRATQAAQQTLGEELAKGASAPLGQVAADGLRATNQVPTPQGAQ